MKSIAVALAELDAVFAGADRLVVTFRGQRGHAFAYEAGLTLDWPVIFESSKTEDIHSLRDCLVLLPSRRSYDCLCHGAPAIHLFASGHRLVELTNLHSQAVRCSLWADPVKLGDVERWVSWFDARGIEGPRSEASRFLRPRHSRSLPALSFWPAWAASAPQSVTSLLRSSEVTGKRLTRLQVALELALPDEHVRVRALLQWFGSGAGPWSGFPAWELTPQRLLSAYPLATIADAIRIGPLNDPMKEGAARLFASWSCQPRFAQHVRELPPEVKSLLWEHVSRSGDQDKRLRAERAFGTAE